MTDIHLRISSRPDNDFRGIVDVLDDHEGTLLREICDATTWIVDGIFYRSLESSTSFVIKNVDLKQIMDCPKRLPRLLKLLSRVQNPLESVAEAPY